MALVLGGRVYTGADALRCLALPSTGSGLFNRVNAAVFRWSRLLYPLRRACRNLALWRLGRPRIRTGR